MELKFFPSTKRKNPAMLEVLVITKLNNASTNYYNHMGQQQHYINTLNSINGLYKSEVRGLDKYVHGLVMDLTELEKRR